MLLIATYLGLLLILALVNSIPILGSKRTRRFGSMPSKIFVYLFIAFGVGKAFVFLYFEINGRGLKENDISYEVTQQRHKTYTRSEGTFSYENRSEFVSDQKRFNRKVNYLLSFCTMQSLLVMLLSYYGMRTIEAREDYYLSKLLIFSGCFIFCVLLEIFL